MEERDASLRPDDRVGRTMALIYALIVLSGLLGVLLIASRFSRDRDSRRDERD